VGWLGRIMDGKQGRTRYSVHSAKGSIAFDILDGPREACSSLQGSGSPYLASIMP
jgi:hypothetical protein